MEGFRFLVVDQAGHRVASAEHIEEATELLRALPSADRVVDASSYVVYAYRPAMRMHRRLRALGVA